MFLVRRVEDNGLLLTKSDNKKVIEQTSFPLQVLAYIIKTNDKITYQNLVDP